MNGLNRESTRYELNHHDGLVGDRRFRGAEDEPSRSAPLLLTVIEVGALLRTSSKAVYALAERRQVPGVVRLGRRLLFRRETLLEWLCQKSNAVAGGTQR